MGRIACGGRMEFNGCSFILPPQAILPILLIFLIR
jgi:hypothetical protein